MAARCGADYSGISLAAPAAIVADSRDDVKLVRAFDERSSISPVAIRMT